MPALPRLLVGAIAALLLAAGAGVRRLRAALCALITSLQAIGSVAWFPPVLLMFQLTERVILCRDALRLRFPSRRRGLAREAPRRDILPTARASLSLPRLALACLVGAALGLTACGGGGNAGGSAPKVQLALVAYSTPQAAYESIIKAFQQTPQGKNVTFTQSYGASGDQSRAVASGLRADIVAFSLEPDMTRLVNAGLVAPNWNKNEHTGMVTQSVVVIGTRKGNPKGLKNWDDLTRPGVEVITPNPFTSGGARWNVMAAYGANSAQGRAHADGVAYLNTLFRHVPVQDDSARKSLQTFSSGKGDAILAYENEAIFAQQKGQPLDYIVPDSTILIENPVAVTSKSQHPKEARAFLDYLWSDQAQKIFADNGYRPVVAAAAQTRAFPTPRGLFTIKDLGGWPTVTKQFFDPRNGIMAGVERKLGVSVGRG